MNFILVSPHFPNTYHKFAAALKARGFTVLGIGDTPFDRLAPEVKTNLVEYYYCPNMNDYGLMFKAVAFLSFKYGKIDWIESHNEWWLLTDAKLRTDFNITTGIGYPDVLRYKSKSRMKASFHQAGAPVARYHLVDDEAGCQRFIAEVGYPVFVKPDMGVGSNFSFKLDNDAELKRFLASDRHEQFIMEEFIDGVTLSYDGVANQLSEVVYAATNVFPMPNYVVVNAKGDDLYYTEPHVPADLDALGRRVIKAFDVRNRIFHLEFFRLNRDYPHLAKKGELVALEVNMRPAGGYTPEMIGATTGCSLYEAWADVVAGNNYALADNERFYIANPARRKSGVFVHSHTEIMEKYSASIIMQGDYPPIISDGMGDTFYMGRFKTKEEVDAFFLFVLTRI